MYNRLSFVKRFPVRTPDGTHDSLKENMSLSKLTIEEQRKGLVDRAFSCVDLVRDTLASIEREQPRVHGYVETFADEALSRARDVDENGSLRARPLGGIPVAIKDNLCYRGHAATCCSKILKGFRAPYNAHVIERLLEAGAIILGRTNMDEFAMGSSTETSCNGLTRNPWDAECVPGGSSGGSAAVVASCGASAALGSDTGGSIRQPAALCGVVGLKPTYGRVSRYGLIAFASSLDQIGPFTRSVRDCARMLQVLAPHDPRDTTSLPEPVPDYAALLDRPVKGLRAGVPREYFAAGIDPQVEALIRKAVRTLEQAGVTLVDISLPHTEYAVPTYYLVATAEASSNLARYDGVQYGLRAENATDLLSLYSNTRQQGFGLEVKRRILLGTYALSAGYYDAYYLKALRVRRLIRQDFDKAFQQCDLILTPASPTAAFRVGEKTSDPLQMYLSDIYTISANLAGLPGLSVPCGLTGKGLPVGLQFLGRSMDEATLLQAAALYEQASGITCESMKQSGGRPA